MVLPIFNSFVFKHNFPSYLLPKQINMILLQIQSLLEMFIESSFLRSLTYVSENLCVFRRTSPSISSTLSRSKVPFILIMLILDLHLY